jgi:hypothetical protein
MSRFVRPITAAFLVAAAAHAQQPDQTAAVTSGTKPPTAQSISRGEERDVSVQPPPADSPFFIERQEAREAAAQAGREGFGMYVPKPPKPPVGQQVKKFFRGLFGGTKKEAASARESVSIMVEPSDFSLSQTPELDVSVRVTNATRNELEFIFPDNQRLEIVLKDDSGTVVSRWSENRSFDRRLGFTEINPSEFVLFAEKLPTSGMKAGRSYTVEVSLANQQGFTASSTITPRP